MLYAIIREQDADKQPAACCTLGVDRRGYLASLASKKSQVPDNSELVKLIREISAMPRYGYRRVTHELRRRNVIANHKRVLRLMREEGLICKRKAFKHRTTNSKHGFRRHPNLVKDLELAGINQVWVSDITYIALSGGETVYLADVMDRYSRKCLGWQMSRSIDAALCIDALQMALKTRDETQLEGLIHHSDQGVQYACNEYTALLEEKGIRISMSDTGVAYDNAHAESFFKTVKYEEVYINEYETLEQARTEIKHFIEVIYNKKRLHSSIGYVPPDEYEDKILRLGVAILPVQK